MQLIIKKLGLKSVCGIAVLHSRPAHVCTCLKALAWGFRGRIKPDKVCELLIQMLLVEAPDLTLWHRARDLINFSSLP